MTLYRAFRLVVLTFPPKVSYVKGLDILCYQFQPALRELQKANPKKISLEDLNHLFGNIDELVQFQQLFLSELKTKMKDFEIEVSSLFFSSSLLFSRPKQEFTCAQEIGEKIQSIRGRGQVFDCQWTQLDLARTT